MSLSLEDDATSNTTGAAVQSPEPQPHSNHHVPPNPEHSSSNTEVRSKRVPPPRRGSVDKDAQDLVISSLRSQVQDLVSQVTELNNKLVKSYDRVSDLEDDLHVSSSSLRSSSLKISQLELERSQHLSALNTGLLVEKSHVTSELTRLMEKATEEAARRGQAESAQAAIEKDLDDVSAALFDQANTMVAEARLERARSERKAEDAERSLRETEDAMRLMQQRLQALQGEKETAERRMDVMTAAMGKGKWIEQAPSSPANARLLLTSHVPYHEFLSFISHLRALRATYPQPPSIHTLLALPFVARLQLEDTDPTVRLDMASALNWLSRRSIIAAIQSGQLTIEPIATQIILASAASPQPPLAVNVLHGSNASNLLSCGLCGHGIVPLTEQLTPTTRTGYLSRANNIPFNTWSSSIFRKSSVPSSPSAPPSPPPYQDASSLPAQIYIFRLSEPVPAFPSALPLCTSGWCLTRLRAACTLWSFLRTNILEKIWEEEVQPLQAPPSHRDIASAHIDKPPVPPRRKTKSSGFWGVASSFGLDRVPGWSEGDKDKKGEQEPEKRRFVAPPLRAASPQPTSLTPPPLPSRNRSRPRTPAVEENGVGRRPSSGTVSSSGDSQSSSSNRQRIPISVKPESSPTLSSLLVSSPDDTDHLNDGFVTPSDELTPATIASISAAESSAPPPPPESAHNTPVIVSASLPAEDTDKTQIESETPPAAAQPEVPPEPKPAEVQKQEPVVVEDVVARHDPPPTAAAQLTSPPSRTGSPVPPPVPRRAAARRPVPPLPPVVRSASPAPTPEVSKAKIAEPNGHVKPEAHTDSDTNKATTAPKSDSTPEVDSPPTEGTVPPTEAAKTEPEAVVVNAEPDSNKSEPEEKFNLQPGEDHSAAAAAAHGPADLVEQTSSPQSAPNETEREKANKEAAQEEKAANKDKARQPPPPPPPPRHPGPVRPVSAHLVSTEKSASLPGKFDKPEEPGFAPDGTPYVGDGTWEERTWKELTRLREDAFWARVGRAQ